MKKAIFGFISCAATCLASDPCFDIVTNPPLYPATCNGDIFISVSGFYWDFDETGLAYAVQNFIHVPVINPTPGEINELNNLVDDDIETPKGNWEFGFKLGIGTNTTCDGWDIGVLWTYYRPSAHTHIEAEVTDNTTLITLLSAFAPIQGEVNFAREIETQTKIKLDLVDLSLGRAYWTSKRTHFRPFVGLRYARLDRKFNLIQKGGSWSPRMNPPQSALNNEASLQNDYCGFGLQSGVEGAFHLSCGFRLYGKGAASIVYGHFDLSHDEQNRLANSPYTKEEILDSKAHFRASRTILDIEAGIAWAAKICQCRYGIQTSLAWEQHIFLHQNQLFRVIRIGDVAQSMVVNDTGENSFQQMRGNFATHGWTLTFAFLF